MAETIVLKTVRVPAELARLLTEVAQERGSSENAIVLECLRRALPQLASETKREVRAERPGR